MTSTLTMEGFVLSFRKQFIFQKGKFGKCESRYYTAYNAEKRLKTDVWAMVVFIHLAPKYGFTDTEIRQELNIKQSLYDVLKAETPQFLSPSYHDNRLHLTIVTKAGLVENHIHATFKVRPAA